MSNAGKLGLKVDNAWPLKASSYDNEQAVYERATRQEGRLQAEASFSGLVEIEAILTGL